jgi:hypothetical protein
MGGCGTCLTDDHVIVSTKPQPIVAPSWLLRLDTQVRVTDAGRKGQRVGGSAVDRRNGFGNLQQPSAGLMTAMSKGGS